MQKGFITTIVIIIIALVILGYFNIDVKAIVDSPQAQENVAYVWRQVQYVYHLVKDTALNFLAK